MSPAAFLRLAWNSLTAPGDVARLLLSLRLGREALLLCFALVVVLNAMVFTLSLLSLPPGAPVIPVLGSPVVFMLTLACAVALTIAALTWAGRALGGKARLAEMAVLVIWLQALRVLVQLALLITLPLSSALAALLTMGAAAAGVWILVNFIDAAHGFGSPLRALLVLLLGATGTALALAFLLTLSGATTMGMNGYV